MEESGIVARYVAILVAACVFLFVCVIVRTKGPLVQLSTCMFVASLVSTQLLVKNLVSDPLNYKFPAWVTVVHFSVVWCLCVLYWTVVGNLRNCLPSSAGDFKRYAVQICPIAVSFVFSVVFNNQSLVFMGMGLVAIIGTLTPITTAVLSHLLGRHIPRLGWAGVCLACLGALIIGSGEVRIGNASTVTWGLVFAIGAVLLRSIKVVLQDRLMAPAAFGAVSRMEEPLAPMHLWALQAPLVVLASATYALMVESLPSAIHQLTPTVVWMILLSAASASVVNILGMFTIKQLGGSSMQIIGKLNTIILVTFSVAFLGETLQAQVVTGTCIVLCGVALFEYAEWSCHKKDSASGPLLKSP